MKYLDNKGLKLGKATRPDSSSSAFLGIDGRIGSGCVVLKGKGIPFGILAKECGFRWTPKCF